MVTILGVAVANSRLSGLPLVVGLARVEVGEHRVHVRDPPIRR